MPNRLFRAALLGFMLVPTAAMAQDAQKPIRALLVLGGCCHDYAKQKDILTQGISKRTAVEWTVAYDPDTSTKHKNPVYDSADWYKNFDVIVHDECSADVTDLKVVEGILAPHRKGLPAVVLHCGMHSYRSPDYPRNTPWFEFTGMNTNHHGPQLPIEIAVADKDHPAIKGMENWTTINEELYHAESVADTAHVLATGKQKGDRYKDESPVIWTNDYKGTRIFATTLGHNNQTVNDDRYLDLIAQGMLWAVDRKPADGPAAKDGKASPEDAKPQPKADTALPTAQQIAADLQAPPGFELTVFAKPPQVNYPTSVSAAPTGELFVAIDQNGSLDKESGRGRVVKCVDTDGDGQADKFTDFAKMDYPRGVIWDAGTLYVLHPPFLEAYHDDNNDGVADRSDVLVRGITVEKTQNARGADHTTNGIRLGIDGWIYVAMGDFGATKAVGKDGTELTHRGGGIVRVRTDGSGLETYTSGQRNIYDVAIDPQMNAFTRDNTNDGDGWNDRLSYIIPNGNYGYPTLFRNFGDEIVQPLADYGGGSPCGSLFVNEPSLPPELQNTLLTVEWGQNAVYRHPLTADGAGYKAGEELLMKLPRGTDIDVDGQGRLYLSSWANGEFTFRGPNVGYLVRLSPKGQKPAAFPDLGKASVAELVKHLAAGSGVLRQASQREILRRSDKDAAVAGLEQLAQSDAPLAARAAAIFTLKQLRGSAANAFLANLSRQPAVRELALRALSDRKGDASVPAEPFLSGLKDENPRVRLVAAWCAGRVGLQQSVPSLLELTADPDPLVSHEAIQSLILLQATAPALAAVDTARPKVQAGALRVLQAFHDSQVVDGLVAKLKSAKDADAQLPSFSALARLAMREGEWDGSWWGTRPDTRGPYFEPTTWAATDRIKVVLRDIQKANAGTPAGKQMLRELVRHRIDLPELPDLMAKAAADDPTMRPLLLETLSGRHELFPEQLKLVLPIASADAETPEVRAKALRLLAQNARSPEALDALVAPLSAVAGMDHPDPALADVLGDFVRNPRLGRDVPYFTKLAASPSDARRQLAYAVLLNTANRKQGGNDGKKAAADAIEKAWEKPDSAASLLRAIGRTKSQGYKDWIEVMLTDSSADVVRAANFAAEELDMKHAGPSADTREMISSLGFEKTFALAIETKGDAVRGKELFTKQGCIACHTVSPGEAPKGPFLGGISARYNKQELAESILKPSAKIAQGFDTQAFKTKDGTVTEGFVTRESGDEVELRIATGAAITLNKKDIDRRAKRDKSIMPEGLVANLTPQDLASLLAYLQSLKAN